MAEIRRVLVPGGRLGLTVWGHIKASSGAWALAPFKMAAAEEGREPGGDGSAWPAGVGEQLLAEQGFVDIERIEVPFVWEFADPDVYARALASTGPAYEAIQMWVRKPSPAKQPRSRAPQIREGRPLRASINVVGFVGVKPNERGDMTMGTIGFLDRPVVTPEAQAIFDEDIAEDGYVMNVSRLWAYNPDLVTGLFDLMRQAISEQALSFRHRGSWWPLARRLSATPTAPLPGVRSWPECPIPTWLQE